MFTHNNTCSKDCVQEGMFSLKEETSAWQITVHCCLMLVGMPSSQCTLQDTNACQVIVQHSVCITKHLCADNTMTTRSPSPA